MEGDTTDHTEQSWTVVLDVKVLIIERTSINTRRARSIAVDKVSTLDHEILDDPMEDRGLVAEGEVVFAILSRAELTKVLGRSASFRPLAMYDGRRECGVLGDDVGEELKLDTARGSVSYVYAGNRTD